MIESAKLVCMWSLAMSVACGNKAAETKSEDGTVAAPAEGEAKIDDAKAAASASVDTRKDICRSFDKDAVATALGWDGLAKVTGVGGSKKGVRYRNCGFIGKNANTDQHFGVTFSTATDFEAEHVGFAAKYEPRATVSAYETRVAKTDEVVLLQIRTAELLVTVDAAQTGKTPSELEPKLEAAAIALLRSLPPDARTILETK